MAGEEQCESLYQPGPILYDPPRLIRCVRIPNHAGVHEAADCKWNTLSAYVGTKSARDKQVGGDHYKGGTMQPVDVIDAFGLNFYEGSALKYLLRWRKKNGVEDLQKCVHYLEMLIEREQKNNGTQ